MNGILWYWLTKFVSDKGLLNKVVVVVVATDSPVLTDIKNKKA